MGKRKLLGTNVALLRRTERDLSVHFLVLTRKFHVDWLKGYILGGIEIVVGLGIKS